MVAGRKPKPAGQAVNRTKPVHDWVEVEAFPYDGPSPDLPDDVAWSSYTRELWEAARVVPHARLWSAGEWLIHIAAMFAVEKNWENPTSEMRLRVAKIGMTAEDLRDLRIRYIEPTAEATENVSRIDDYRDL